MERVRLGMERVLQAVLLGLTLLAAASAVLWVYSTVDKNCRWIQEAHIVSPAGEQQKVLLPWVMPHEQTTYQGSVVKLRMVHNLERAPVDRMGIYIRKMSVAGSLKLNGVELGSCVPGALQTVRCLHQPSFYDTDPKLWRSGPNELVLELYTNSRQTNGMSPIAIGRTNVAYWNLFVPDYTQRVTLLHALTWATVWVGLFSLAIGWTLRSEELYIWFALACFFNAMSNINGLLRSSPVDPDFYSWFVFSTRLVSGPLVVLSVLAFFEKRWMLARQVMIGFCFAAPTIVYFFDTDRALAAGLHVFNLIACGSILSAMPYWYYKSRKRRDLYLTLACSIIGVGAARDWLKLQGSAAFEEVYLIAYLNTAFLLVMGYVIADLLIESLRTSRELTASLELKVAQREAALARSFAARADLERQAARTHERENLMRDVHDGLGSALSSARLALQGGRATSQQASSVIAECIDELRLLLENSDNQEGLLSNAIADYRFRINRRLSVVGLRVVWHLQLDDEPSCKSFALLQIMRILQEAVHNVTKHAQASQLVIEARWDPLKHCFVVGVTDDGVGVEQSHAVSNGRGIANMRTRASKINAQLLIQGGPNARGTHVQLVVPFGDEVQPGTSDFTPIP